MARFAPELSQAAKDWLASEPDGSLVDRVLDWIENELCDEESSVHEDPVEVPVDPARTRSRQRFFAARVTGTDIAVTFFEARPFRTIKVMWIERMSEVLGPENAP